MANWFTIIEYFINLVNDDNCMLVIKASVVGILLFMIHKGYFWKNLLKITPSPKKYMTG